MLYKYKKIILMGTSHSFTSALQLQATLFSNNIITQVISAPYEQQKMMHNLDEDTLVIVFSVSGNFFKNTLKEEAISKPKDSKIVLITQSKGYIRMPVYDSVICTETKTDYSSDHTPFSVICSLISLACYQIKDEND